MFTNAKKIFIFLLVSILLILSIDFLLFLTVITQDFKSINNKKNFTFRIDNSFTPTEMHQIIQSMKEWQTATNDRIKINYYFDTIMENEIITWGEDGIPTIYNNTSGLKYLYASYLSYSFTNKIVGFTFSNTMDIFIVSNEEFKIIIKHELGHLLGCSHSNNENSIMYLYTNNNKGKILQEQLDEIL